MSAARQEENPTIRYRLYSLFSNIDFPDDPEELIDVAREVEDQLHGNFEGYNTASYLLQAVARLRHPSVVIYMYDLLKQAKETKENDSRDRLLQAVIDIWVNNYSPSKEDDDALYWFLMELPEDRSGVRHSAAYAILHGRIYEKPFDNPIHYQFLYWVLSDTHCPHCRKEALEKLIQFDKPQIPYVKAFLHDCNPETVNLAREWLEAHT